LWATPVLSSIERIESPAALKARIDVSRPFPRPFITISIFSIPSSIALIAAFFAALCAAKGVFLRDPLKPDVPEEAQQTVFPKLSQIVIMVLLKVLFTLAIPKVIFFLFLTYEQTLTTRRTSIRTGSLTTNR